MVLSGATNPSQAPISARMRRAQRWLLFPALALTVIVSGCTLPPSSNMSGDTSPQEKPVAACNVSLFQPIKFSTSQQDGTTLFLSYATDTSFTQEVVEALNLHTQHPLWQRTFLVSANAALRLTAADGVVYALFEKANFDHIWLFALDAQTGQQLWSFDEADAADLVACYGTLVLTGRLTTHVFAGTTGKLLWTYNQLTQGVVLGSTLSITRNTIYLMGYNSEQATVFALNLQEGKEQWQTSLPNMQLQEDAGTLTYTEQALYVLQSRLEQPGHLFALRPQDGKQIWSTTSPDAEEILMASGGTLYLANEVHVDAVQTSNGKHLWFKSFAGPANFVTGAAQHGIFEVIFEEQIASPFCSLDLTNGTPKWCLSMDLLEWAGTPFFVDNTTIYLLSEGSFAPPDDNHILYLVDAQTGNVRQHLNIHPLIGAITLL